MNVQNSNPILSKTEKLVIGIGATLVASIYWSPAFFSLQSTGHGDWQAFHHMWEAGYVALTRYGEWPLWDPYHCGGITIFGNPESQHLAPLYFLSFLVGPTVATKIFVWLHAIAGIWGMAVLARREYRLSPSSSALASLAWGTSGFFAWHGAGHITFMPFYLTPWIILAWRYAARDFRFTAVVAALLTLVLLEGGTYPFPYLVLIIAFDACVRLVEPGQRIRIFLAGVLSAVLTALMGAVRILPIFDELHRNPRYTTINDSVSIFSIIEMLTSRSHAQYYGLHPYFWSEYGAFVGWGVVALGALGIAFIWRTRYRHWVAGLVLFGFLVAGDLGTYSPWPLLHHIPAYDSLRVNSRFMVYLTFYLALLAAFGLQRLVSWIPGSSGNKVHKIAPWLIVLALTIDIFAVCYPINNRWKRAPTSDVGKPAERFYLTTSHTYSLWNARLPRMNLGSDQCYSAMHVEVADGLWTGDSPQVRIQRTTGSIHDWGRTTSTVWAEVTLDHDGRVIFNQNYAPGWRSAIGEAVQDEGRLAVDLKAGRQRIEFTYLPPTLIPSICISLFGLFAAAYVGFFLKRKNRVPGLNRAVL